MHKQNRFVQALTPSWASGLLSAGLSVVILAVSTSYYYFGSGFVYEFLFGQSSSTELLSQSQGSLTALKDTVFGNSLLNKILYFIFWMIVGLVVYFLLYVSLKGASSAVAEIEEATYKNTRVDQLLEGLFTRTAIRAGFALLWLAFCILFVKYLLPLSVLSARVGVSEFPAPSSWMFMLVALVMLTISLHIHVVFMRLIALRVRLFS